MKTRKIQLKIDSLITAIALILAVICLSMISKLTIDSSTEVFMPINSEAVKTNDIIESEFGSLDAIILGIVNEKNSILNSNSLLLIDSLTNQIEMLDGVNSVNSITNLSHIEDDEFGLEVVPLYEGADTKSIKMMSNKLNNWPEIYEGTFISKDKTMASIIITIDKEIEYSKQKDLIDSILSFTKENSHNSEEFLLIGIPIVKQQINESLVSDMIRLSPIVGLLILLVLALTLKKISGVFLPLLTLFLSASYIIGIMVIFNITFTMATMLVPVLLLIVASAYTIHVMSHFYEEILSYNGHITFSQIMVIINSVIIKNKKPIILAGLTTAAGFLAQLTSPLSPFRMFGLLSAIGVIISQIASLFLLPSFLRLTYRNGINKEIITKWKIRDEKGFKQVFSKYISNLVINHKKSIILLSLILATITIILVPNIKSGTNMINFFRKDSTIVKHTNLYNEKMAGSGVLNIMISNKSEKRILNPTFLNALENFEKEIEQFSQVGKIRTIVLYVTRMNYLLNQKSIPYQKSDKVEKEFDFFSDSFSLEDNTTEIIEIQTNQNDIEYDTETFREIPTDPLKYGLESEEDLTNLISQYLVLYSGNLEYLINDSIEPDKTNITITLYDTEREKVSQVIDFIYKYWSNYTDYEIAVGGGEAISLALTELVTKSQIYSLIASLFIIFCILSVLFKSIKIGLIGLIPVGFALMGIFLTMSLLAIPLDIVTSLLAALAIGIGVDYAIHYISAYRRIVKINKEISFYNSIMNTTGNAIIINMLSITLGFVGLSFSKFIPIQQMGILFCISMFAAGISSITVLPIALSLFDNQIIRKVKNEK
ncbi:MAG: efflux RND transporter permease subunit [Pleomorphochaeta sp.]